MEKKVWYVTGASRGIGLALIKQLLAAGHRVAAASKFLPALVEAVSKTPDAGFLPLEFDAADEPALASSIHTTWETFGAIDTVVTNAGYAAADPYETAAIIRNVLPWLHTQGSGHIISIGLPKLPLQYSRYQNIHVTTVLRTSSHVQDAAIEDAAAKNPGARDTAVTMTIPIDGKQIGDPEKAAAALLTIAALPQPPSRLYLASNARNLAAEKMATLDATIRHLETIPQAAYDSHS